jgi:uroporphyrinogen decarboxylase
MISPDERRRNREIAFNLEEPDMVPWDLFLETEFMAAYAGITIKEYQTKLDKAIETQIAVQRRLLGEVRSLDYSLFNAQSSTFGCQMIFTESGHKIKEPLIKDTEDLERLGVPDPLKDGLMPEVIKRYDYVKKKWGNKYCIPPPVGTDSWAPFTLSALLRGQYQIFIDIYRDPELMHKLLQYVTEAIIKRIEAGKEFEKESSLPQIVLESSLNGVWLSDDLACFLPPPMYEKFALPYNMAIYEYFGGDRLYHSESMGEKHLPLLSKMGIDYFLPDTRMIYVDIKTLKRCLEGKIAVEGFIDNWGSIKYGTPADVEEEVKKALSEGAPGGGFELLVDLCNWVPLDNIDAFIRAIEKYGKSPFREKKITSQ